METRLIYGDRDTTLVAKKIAEDEQRLRLLNERARTEFADITRELSRLEEMLAEGTETGGRVE
jgi:hypothetical protein